MSLFGSAPHRAAPAAEGRRSLDRRCGQAPRARDRPARRLGAGAARGATVARHREASGPAEAPGRRGRRPRRAGRGARRPAPRRAAQVDHGTRGTDRAEHRDAGGPRAGRTHRRRYLGDRCRARRDDPHRRLGAAQARDLRRRAADHRRRRRGPDRGHAARIGLRDHQRGRPARARRGGIAALQRALDEGQPGLRILASLAGGSAT